MSGETGDGLHWEELSPALLSGLSGFSWNALVTCEYLRLQSVTRFSMHEAALAVCCILQVFEWTLPRPQFLQMDLAEILSG